MPAKVVQFELLLPTAVGPAVGSPVAISIVDPLAGSQAIGFGGDSVSLRSRSGACLLLLLI